MQPPQNWNLKNPGLVDIMISKVLCDFPFSQNQPLKSADGQYIRILEKKNKSKIKKQEDRTLWLHHRMCSCICIYTNTITASVMLCLHVFLQHHFKIKHIIHSLRVSAPTQGKILGAHLGGCNTTV
jgi:hypothetical protein